MSNYKYDEGYVRALLNKLPGKSEDIVKAFAEVHDVRVDASGNGLYRSPDLVSILTESVNQKNRLARIDDNLESKVEISKLKAVYHTTKEITGNVYSYLFKKVFTRLRYIAYGALPAKIQFKLARHHNENVGLYSFANWLFTFGGSVGLAIYGSIIRSNPTMITALGVFGLELSRFIYACGLNSYTSGSPVLTIPYHILMTPYNTVKSISEIYSKKKLELETIELSRLPSAKKGTESGGSK